MKQVKFLLTAITIILIASCATVSVAVEETTGELILTDIPDHYNGKIITAQTDLEKGFNLLAIDSIDSNGRITGVVVRDGIARLNVWKVSAEGGSNYRVHDYRGNETVELTIILPNTDRPYQPWNFYFDPSLGRINAEFIDGKASFSLIMITEETVGELVITNIPARFNGSLLSAQTNYGNDPFLIAADSISSNNATGVVIENGSATLKVWEVFQIRDKLNYNGYDSVGLQLMIHPAGTVFTMGNHSYDGSLGRINVVFNNGRAEHRLR